MEGFIRAHCTAHAQHMLNGGTGTMGSIVQCTCMYIFRQVPSISGY